MDIEKELEERISNYDQKDYYDNLYCVSLWSGAGYTTDIYFVYANNEMNALEIAVMYAAEEGFSGLYSYDEVVAEWNNDPEIELDDYIDQNFVYVDTTMEGGDDVYYVLQENLNIMETNIEEVKELISKEEN